MLYDWGCKEIPHARENLTKIKSDWSTLSFLSRASKHVFLFYHTKNWRFSLTCPMKTRGHQHNRAWIWIHRHSTVNKWGKSIDGAPELLVTPCGTIKVTNGPSTNEALNTGVNEIRSRFARVQAQMEFRPVSGLGLKHTNRALRRFEEFPVASNFTFPWMST